MNVENLKRRSGLGFAFAALLLLAVVAALPGIGTVSLRGALSPRHLQAHVPDVAHSAADAPFRQAVSPLAAMPAQFGLHPGASAMGGKNGIDLRAIQPRHHAEPGEATEYAVARKMMLGLSVLVLLLGVGLAWCIARSGGAPIQHVNKDKETNPATRTGTGDSSPGWAH